MTKIINVGIIVQQEVLVNYLIGEDALEIGNFERAKILDLLEFGEKIKFIVWIIHIIRNRFKTYEVCMEYCDDVMQKEKDMSSDPNGDSETTNDIAPDSGRY